MEESPACKPAAPAPAYVFEMKIDLSSEGSWGSPGQNFKASGSVSNQNLEIQLRRWLQHSKELSELATLSTLLNKEVEKVETVTHKGVVKFGSNDGEEKQVSNGESMFHPLDNIYQHQLLSDYGEMKIQRYLQHLKTKKNPTCQTSKAPV